MSITKITPLMQTALRDRVPLEFFADLWLSVLNKAVDSQDDFNASVSSTNMDFDANPGYARLATQAGAFNIEQTSQNSSHVLYEFVGSRDQNYWFLQTFTLSPGRQLSDVTVLVDNTGQPTQLVMAMICRGNAGIVAADQCLSYINENGVAMGITIVAAGYSGEVVIPIMPSNIDLSEGKYTLVITGVGGILLKYQNSDVYSGGQLYQLQRVQRTVYPIFAPQWTMTSGLGDLYFKLSLSGYYPTGSFTTKTLDLGEVPVESGVFQLSADVPDDTSLSVTLYSSTTGAFAGEETTYSDITDGYETPAVRYWRMLFVLTSDADLSSTPLIDMAELIYPKDRMYLRESGRKLNHVSAEIDRDFHPLIKTLDFKVSEMKVLERVASGGSVSMVLADVVPDTLQRIVSSYPLKNYRCAMYAGADVPGFGKKDLLRFFIGIVDSARIKPKYRSDEYALSLNVKNPILELKRKTPLSDQTAIVTADNIAIDLDGTHVIDAALALQREYGRIPARYINLESFNTVKPDISGTVYRSNSGVKYTRPYGSPDSSNTGNGSVVNVATTSATKKGDYILLCKTAAAGGGTFSVTDPDGVALADATVETPYAEDEIQFLITAGTVDYVVGSKPDKFTIRIYSPDLRIKSPEEISKLMQPVAEIGDFYIVEDESSRITCVLHDPDAAAEETWADEAMIRAGEVDAIPIEAVGDINLGYDDFLFNLCYVGCEWDGEGSDWSAFHVYADIDADSGDEWGMGTALHVNVMEKNMKEVSKWLGPENGYSGRSQAAAIAARAVARYAYPPVRMTGVIAPISEFMRTVGSVIQFHSKEFVKLGRVGIAPSETKKFMITKKKYNRGKNRMEFDLLELT